MRALVLCDDHWHPGRTPHVGLEALGQNHSFDWIHDAGEWSAERMGRYPLVILSKSNNLSADNEDGWVTEAVEAAFVSYVRQGKGLLAIHSGIAGWQDMHLLRSLLGGVFDHHPPQCPVTVEPRAGHPLAAGCDRFTLVDEHYFVALEDAEADVFLTTESEHGAQPGGWRRREGAGRVGVLTPGHNPEVWTHSSFQALLANLIRWCGRIEEPAARAESRARGTNPDAGGRR